MIYFIVGLVLYILALAIIILFLMGCAEGNKVEMTEEQMQQVELERPWRTK